MVEPGAPTRAVGTREDSDIPPPQLTEGFRTVPDVSEISRRPRTGAPTRTARREPRAALRRLDLVIPLLFVIGMGARLLPVWRGGGLRGLLGYDEGVYFATANALLAGRLPYDDVLLLHPPGIAVVVAPFAWLARLTSDPTGLAAARLAFMAVGALTAVLLYLVGRRLGRVTGLVAGGLYAVWGPSVYSERTIMLESLGNLGLAASLYLIGDPRHVSRRRLLLAGAVLGAATAAKVWTVVPLLLVAGWLLVRAGRAVALRYVGAAAVATTVVCLPFFVAAPAAMFRMVILDQLRRPDNGSPPALRLVGLLDMPRDLIGGRPAAVLGAAAAVGIALLAVAAWRALPESRIWVVLLVTQTAMVFAAAAYYRHYDTYIAPALVLVLGAGAQVLVTAARRRSSWLTAVTVGLVALVLVLAAVNSLRQTHGRRPPGPAAQAALADARCVNADNVGALAVLNVLNRNLERGCPLVVDVTGVVYDTGTPLRPGKPSAIRRGDPKWQAFAREYFTSADALVIVQRGSDGLTPETAEVLDSQKLVHRGRGYFIYHVVHPAR